MIVHAVTLMESPWLRRPQALGGNILLFFLTKLTCQLAFKFVYTHGGGGVLSALVREALLQMIAVNESVITGQMFEIRKTSAQS